MTEKQLREKVVDIMEGWVGCKESDGSHKKIIDTYNSHKPYARGYKMPYDKPWCAATVSAAFIKAGLTDIGFVECSCSQMIELYKAKGRWQEADSHVPSPGDLLMYDWGDSGSGDCTGAPDHVGMVVSVTSKTIRVIEGNKNDAVGYRNLSVNGRYIRGYCLPDYASKAVQMSKPVEEKKPKVKVDPAKYFNRAYAKSYAVTASALHLRAGAGTNKSIIQSLPKGTRVRCYGYYSWSNDSIWLYVKLADGTVGFCSKKYLT